MVEDMIRCDSEGPLLCQVTKMYPSQDATVFHALTRVYSGTLHAGYYGDISIMLLSEDRMSGVLS